MSANQLHHKPATYTLSWFKRAFDLALSGLLSMLTLPLVLVLALRSAIAFKAWPFFVQERIGLRGRPFRFVKIRSLPSDAPRYIDKYALAPRPLCRWGRWLRASHLDELPQLWLVVQGKMSLVGPRPEMAAVAARFDPGFVAARTSVRPGCTGAWQVSVASAGLIDEDSRYDLLYLEHARFNLDLWLLYRTVVQILGRPPLTCERIYQLHREAHEHRSGRAVDAGEAHPASRSDHLVGYLAEVID